MDKPKLLDLFCGAGGAARGYQLAGFHVTGIDNRPQSRYGGDLFIQADALNPPVRLEDFDVVHASPPCQAYSAGARMRMGYAKDHPRLIEPTRDMLRAWGGLYVIENVPGAPLMSPRRLCGSSFGLQVRRHRDFETNVPMWSIGCSHYLQPVVVGVYGDHPEDSVVRKGHPAIRAKSVQHARTAMGMDWPSQDYDWPLMDWPATWEEIKEAIPPAYTEFIGQQLIEHLERAKAEHS